jgi:hypothetical protein
VTAPARSFPRVRAARLAPAPALRHERLGPALVAAGVFLLHALCWNRYGAFRDELYFIVCGQRLGAGYVDQPPGIAVVARVANALFGTWVPGLRLFPWIATAGAVYLTGRLAARLGGGPAGATLASIAAASSPMLLALGHFLTMNAFEPLLTVALALVLLRLAQGDDPRLWVAAGALAGLAVLFKYTSALLALALVLGMLATPARRALRTTWVLAGAAVGLLAVLPNLAWQAAHGFPFLELVRNGQLRKNAPFTVGGFFLSLFLEPSPLLAPLWVGGLAWLLLAGAPGRRFLGIGAVLYLAFLLASHGKAYYLAPALPIALAGGGAAAAALVRRRAGRVAIGVAFVASGLALAPLAIPLLSERAFVRWQRMVGVRQPPMERSALGPLPQIHADQHGWRELAEAVQAAAATLTPEERVRAVVLGRNYGEAAAIDVYGPALGLPPAISGQNQYWLWGVPAGRGDPAIVISDEHEECGHAFHEKVLVQRLPHSPWVMPYEDERWIWICRGATQPLEALWPQLKRYI